MIGTSTNLVVHGMILESGHEGFTMFELGKVGIFIAIAGIIYLFAFSKKLLPDARPDTAVPDEEVEEGDKLHRVEAVLGAVSRVSTKLWESLILNVTMVPKLKK